MQCRSRIYVRTLLLLAIAVVPASGLLNTAYGMQLDVNTYITNGTCDISSTQPVIVFSPVSTQLFNQPKKSVQLTSFKVELKDCMTLSGGTLRPSVRVNGAVSQEDRYLFQSLSPDSAAGVGVILRQGDYKGSPSNFYEQNALVSDGTYTHIGQQGEAAINGQLNYTIALSNGVSQSAVTPGDVLAHIQFSFDYQ